MHLPAPTPAPLKLRTSQAMHLSLTSSTLSQARFSFLRWHSSSRATPHATSIDQISISIRPAREADVPRLAEIEQLCGGLSASWSAADIRAELDKDMSHAFVAAAGSSEEAVGYIVAWLVAGELQVLELAVDPAHQSQGIGSKLLRHALQEVSHGEGAVLEVKAHNVRAIRLYQRHGFQEVGRRRRFYADGSDALLMSRMTS